MSPPPRSTRGIQLLKEPPRPQTAFPGMSWYLSITVMQTMKMDENGEWLSPSKTLKVPRSQPGHSITPLTNSYNLLAERSQGNQDHQSAQPGFREATTSINVSSGKSLQERQMSTDDFESDLLENGIIMHVDASGNQDLTVVWIGATSTPFTYHSFPNQMSLTSTTITSCKGAGSRLL